jgi:hypothetical protein
MIVKSHKEEDEKKIIQLFDKFKVIKQSVLKLKTIVIPK